MTGYENHDTAELKRLLAEPDDYIGPPVKRRIREELASRRNVVSSSPNSKASLPDNGAVGGGPVKVTLPWEVLCSVNERQNPHSGFTLTRKYRKARADIEERARGQYAGPVLAGPVAIRFDFYPPSRRPDMGNYTKAVKDSLQGVAYKDDGQIKDERLRWMYIDKEAPRVEIVVEAITSTEEAA